MTDDDHHSICCCVRSSIGRAWDCGSHDAGSNPVGHPNGAIGEFGRPRLPVTEKIAGSNPAGPV